MTCSQRDGFGRVCETPIEKSRFQAQASGIIARCCIILTILLLSGCSSAPSALEPVYVAPSPPTEKAIASGVAALAGQAKLVAPEEISEVRPNDHGPGSFFVCVREANLPPDKPHRYFSVFFDNDKYEGSRPSVIMDQCELQTYRLAPAAAPATPPPPEAKPAKHKSHKQTQ
jgi:hypothetical protein